MPYGYRSRHARVPAGRAPSLNYSASAIREYAQIQPMRSSEDEARLKALYQHRSEDWSQSDREAYEDIMDRDEEREEARRAPLQKEIESYFAHLGLAPLPPPLPKSSLWLAAHRPCQYPNAEIRPFFIACEEGSLDEVRRWVQDKRQELRQMGVQDGLACAANGNQVHVARYLLEEGGASLHGAVVKAACRHRSLALFQVCAQHGYHPNQQIPSNNGHFGTALIHCIEGEEITRFLLQNGADPDVGPWLDGRCLGWGERSTPPLDRTSGFALDLAVEKGSLATVEMLLDHGAHMEYSRPLHRVIKRLRERDAANLITDEDWRPLMEMFLQKGANINAVTYMDGTALIKAVSNRMWDITQFLLEHGADPRIKRHSSGADAFAVAAKVEGIAWEVTEDVDKYLSYLCESKGVLNAENAPDIPDEARRNRIVRILEEGKGVRTGLKPSQG
ncbi:hypothetical protein ACJ41O_009112 [Fusarium nematophilum]